MFQCSNFVDFTKKKRSLLDLSNVSEQAHYFRMFKLYSDDEILFNWSLRIEIKFKGNFQQQKKSKSMV